MADATVTVLVVDDDAYILDFVSGLLRETGYHVLTASNASLAIGMVDDQKIDIVLSDIKMPGMSGVEMLEKIHDRAPDLPVILMTAYADLQVAIDAVKRDAFDFITKPFKPKYLVNSLEKAARFVRLLGLEKSYKDILEENVRQRTRELNDRCLELKELHSGLIHAFANAIDAKSRWTKGHSERVSLHAVSIAKEMGLETATIEDIRIAGLLHDIGKIGTYDVILDKPGKLTAEEFAFVKMHPAKGEEILAPIRQLHHILPCIRGHHEKMDGTGYPDGLKGEEIPLLARILCVADAFDAIMADRPYRPSPGLEYAMSEFNKYAGQQFDPAVTEVFLRILTAQKR